MNFYLIELKAASEALLARVLCHELADTQSDNKPLSVASL